MSVSSVWTDREREVLGAVADLLIPASGDMPSATAVGVVSEGIDEIAAIRPDLLDAGRRAVELLGADRPDSVAAVQAVLSDLFGPVSELLASAYFLRPEVARLIGYRSRRAIPLDDESSRRDQLEQLVEPVRVRGNVWRRTEGP